MLSYGPRLDERTYYRAVTALYLEVSGKPSKASELKRRQDELNLTIDHKLGVDFPIERREAVWAAQRRVDRRLIPLVLLGYLKRAIFPGRPVEEPLLSSAIRELGTVLSLEELNTMLDLPMGGSGASPPLDGGRKK